MVRIRNEQETTITFKEAEADVLVWSASPSFHRRMEKLGLAPYEIAPGCLGAEEGEQSRRYRILKDCLRIRPRRRVSDAERARLRAQGFQGLQGQEGS